jgi:HK97 family phage major capsid protein
MYSHGVTRQLLQQSSDDVEAIIRSDTVMSQARELDRVSVLGTSTANEPTGIANTSGIGSVTIGTNGGAITWAKTTAVEATSVHANGILNETAGYLTNAKVANDMKNIFKGTAGFLPIWDGPASGAPVNGYPCHVTSTVPSNLTKGTSTTICSLLAFSTAWNEVLVGQWGGGGFAEVIVDPYSQKKLGIVELTSYALLDLQLRHAASFTVCPDITTTL